MIWNEAKKQKIRDSLTKKLTPFMQEVIILKQDKNMFGSKTDNLKVCTVNGYYHTGTSAIVNTLTDSSNINSTYQDRFLLIVDDNSRLIQEKDYFTLNGITYTIVDMGNSQDIVFDTSLSREV